MDNKRGVRNLDLNIKNNKIKKVYLIHGWEANSKSDFFPWLKKELQKKGFAVVAFDMPNTDNPKIEEWVGYLIKNIENVDEQTYFVGHSIGCQAILRFLETLSKEIKIDKCIFVAPWLMMDKKREQTLKDEGEEVWETARPWVEKSINFKKIKTRCKNFICIFSSDDPYVSPLNVNLFKDKLNAKILILKNKGHFNTETGISEIPEILEFIK